MPEKSPRTTFHTLFIAVLSQHRWSSRQSQRLRAVWARLL